MSEKQSLTATDLAAHQHKRCDLYLHNVYHGRSALSRESDARSPSDIFKAHLKRGIDWETSLLSWLERSNLLLRVPSSPLKSDGLRENILADERTHFFIAGLTFWPSRRDMDQRFSRENSDPLAFGLAKPDLLEIQRTEKRIFWRVIDAKASKHFSTSHQIQTYFYTLCLDDLLRDPSFQSADTTGVWLSPGGNSETVIPSFDDIKTITLSLVAPIFNALLFRELPKVVALPYEEVKWHYNPLCRGCRFETQCRTRALDEGKIGSMPNISIEDAKVLKDLLQISRVASRRPLEKQLPEIEELHKLFDSDTQLDCLARSPVILKRAKQILAIPKKSSSMQRNAHSPAVEASRSKQIQVVPRRSTRCPSREDIAIVISVIDDPSSPAKGARYFGVTVHSEKACIIRPPVFARSSIELVSRLGNLIRSIQLLRPRRTCQFYVWSSSEYHTLQNTIVEAALTSDLPREDIAACIGTLSEGASLLHTTFQPLLLSGALLSFLTYSNQTRIECETCLDRMGLPTEGTIQSLQERLRDGIRKLQEAARSSDQEGRRAELGQLSHVVVLKKEIERQLALPIPGHWDLQECVHLFSPSADPCPTNDEIFVAYKNVGTDDEYLQGLLNYRNRMIYKILLAFRNYATAADGTTYLVNEAKLLSPQFMDICKEEHTRKLFFMQQFEVLTKLTELWQSRIDGCPDAPVLEYHEAVQGQHGTELVFRLLSGIVDIPAPDKDYPLFDKLLVQTAQSTTSDNEDIPVELLFDDLSVSGTVFPLSKHMQIKWTKQDPRVQKGVWVADVRNVFPSRDRQHTMVALRVWGAGQLEFKEGESYRLSPRLVDFNTSKVLATLLEIDILWDCTRKTSQHAGELHSDIPFLQLITQSDSLGELPMAKQYLKTENEIQKLFRDLRELGNISAGSLVLKPSQHKAAQRILSTRLSTIWGPPGTGKTHTICLSLLRLIAVQRRHLGPQRTVIFITAVTHAGVEACYKKLVHLMRVHTSVSSLPLSWLDQVSIQVVCRGKDHPPPPSASSCIHVYAGTIYQASIYPSTCLNFENDDCRFQLHNFAKKHSMQLDCVVVDEAGQVSLGLISLVIRYLAPEGRIIIAGDSEQLAPILSAKYPLLKPHALFGSILDCLIHSKVSKAASLECSQLGNLADKQRSGGHVVQLTENFRLNPDLADFISIIYSRRFRPQKVQARTVAEHLRCAASKSTQLAAFSKEVAVPIQTFLVELSNVMLANEAESELVAPTVKSVNVVTRRPSKSLLPYRAVSLALIHLRSWSVHPQSVTYEMHVQIEAVVAAALVVALQACCPEDDIFVATPHRIQREAVRRALARIKDDDSLLTAFGRMNMSPKQSRPAVTVDTIERLQGLEASFVICLFSLPKSSVTGDLSFLLNRRRLNVAFSRAKTMCILISSDEVLRPTPHVLADETIAEGYAFLKAYQQRAWSYYLALQAEKFL